MEKWNWSGDQRFIRDSWDGSKLSFEKDKDCGFSWPQRNYRCSFCKKEFKSAQALGGHMNVHRRDRARMRLSSPPLMDAPNPNPSFSSSPYAAKVLPYHKTTCHDSSSLSCVSNPPFSPSPDKELHLGPKPTEKFTRDHKLSRKQFDKVSVVDFSKSMEICGGDRGKKNKGAMLEVASRKDARILKVNEFVRLDLSMGFAGDAKDQDLDLELRLGYC